MMKAAEGQQRLTSDRCGKQTGIFDGDVIRHHYKFVGRHLGNLLANY